MLIKCEGIVIRSKDYSEGNKIVTILTKEIGKISMMARGAKKANSRLSSVTQLLTHGHYLLARASSKSMATLQQGELIHSFRLVRQDLWLTSYAAYLAELIDKIIEDNQPHAYYYQLLLEALQYFEDGKDPQVVTHLIELKILQAEGYAPELDQCVSCQTKEGIFSFSIREGGFICERCAYQDEQVIKLQQGTVKVLRALAKISPKQLGNIALKAETKQELQLGIWGFIDAHTPFQLKSRRFITGLNQWLE